MEILISGAGIAGPSLAYWLLQYGFKPTIIELAPKLRSGGYVIDFWGSGFDIAEQMGLMPELSRMGYVAKEVRVIDKNGKRISGFPVEAISKLTQGRYISLARGDLSSAIFNKIEGKVETIFGDSITSIEQSENAVNVSFKRENKRKFDLVIGADGLHSTVRELVFGPEKRFEKYLGYYAAAFEVQNYKPRDELIYMMYSRPGQQVGRFALHGDRTLFMFIFADNESGNFHRLDLQAQKAILHKHFDKSGWECPEILGALDNTKDLYFDRVSQIRMKSEEGLWARGRVALLGDAASCISLMGGQGSALAMVAAYILAGELYKAKGNYPLAFARYQELFAPFVAGKQKSAQQFASSFVPKTPLGLWFRNQLMKMLTLPWAAEQIIGRGLIDKINLPKYPLDVPVTPEKN